jgi:hypothetical protein
MTSRRFVELGIAKVGNKRHVVISSNIGDQGFTLGHKIELEGPAGPMHMFLKGAIPIEDLDALYALRDATNKAIKMVEEEEEEKDNRKDYPPYLDHRK